MDALHVAEYGNVIRVINVVTVEATNQTSQSIKRYVGNDGWQQKKNANGLEYMWKSKTQ